jgi:carboxypeptidase Q
MITSYTPKLLTAVSRTHHTNMETDEHLIPEDLKQAATVVAAVPYNTAMRDKLLPRRPLNR